MKIVYRGEDDSIAFLVPNIGNPIATPHITIDTIKKMRDLFVQQPQGEMKMEEPKKGIRIKTQERIVNGAKRIIVTELSALRREELPEKYLEESHVYSCNRGCHLTFKDKEERFGNFILAVGGEYSEKYFNNALKIIHEAGVRLGKINKARREASVEKEYVI